MNPNDFPFSERPETVAFVWPVANTIADYAIVEPYSVQISDDRNAFEIVQAAIDWELTLKQWSSLKRELIPDSMVFITHHDEPVAVACALNRDDDWAELAWVAVDPKHQGQGLGKIVCSTVVNQVLSRNNCRIFGSTQDSRIAALKIYLDIGFQPVFRPEKHERWLAIYHRLDRVFPSEDKLED